MKSSEAAKFQAAFKEEFDSLVENNVGELVPRPPGKKVVRGFFFGV